MLIFDRDVSFQPILPSARSRPKEDGNICVVSNTSEEDPVRLTAQVTPKNNNGGKKRTARAERTSA